jgi:hypothetical protein
MRSVIVSISVDVPDEFEKAQKFYGGDAKKLDVVATEAVQQYIERVIAIYHVHPRG